MPSGWSSYIWLSSPIANKYPEDVKPYKDRIKYKKHNFLGSATHMSYSEVWTIEQSPLKWNRTKYAIDYAWKLVFPMEMPKVWITPPWL